MFKRAINLLFGRKSATTQKEEMRSVRKAKPDVHVATQYRTPEWESVLTFSLKENALAPSDEVILHAYNLYCDELNAPFASRRRAMSEHFSNVIAEFAALQALAPDLIERAAAKHRLELDRFLEKKGHKS